MNKKNMQRLALVLMGMFSWSMFAVAATNPTHLKVCGLNEPLCIDTPMPTFSWQIQSGTRDYYQSAYRIVVCDDKGLQVWDSGVTPSRQQNSIVYGGSPLASRSRYTYSVTLYDKDGNASEEAVSSFGTAFLDASEWTAQWITRSIENRHTCMSIELDSVQARYVKLDVTKLGIPASSESHKYYLQLAEMEIYSGGVNVAPQALFVTTSDNYQVGSSWSKAFINDGKIMPSGPLGYTTHDYPNANQSVYVIIKLDDIYDIDRIVLYPRQDEHAYTDATRAANFPASFTIMTSNSGASNSYEEVYRAENVEAPLIVKNNTNVPYYGKSIRVDKPVKRATMFASALGVFTMRINGKPVTENLLEPGETQYTQTVLYTTYDVTSLLTEGANSLVAQVAGALFDISYLDGIGGLTQRYSKRTLTNAGPASLKAELLIEYTDGTTDTIVTDGTWRTTASPTTGSNWWGGEDYDATCEIEGIDDANYDFSAWDAVDVVMPTFTGTIESGPIGTLRAKMNEPLRVVETWNAVSVKPLKVGGKQGYLIDFGRNFAGQYTFTLKGEKGQIITLRPGEKLNTNGTVVVDFWNTPPFDNYDSYTFAGKPEGETWGPTFMYHGCRYLQVLGLTEVPEPTDFTAYRIRANIAQSGQFTTSNDLINNIHTICRDGIQSQLYNTVTDCPHREKLGWMDVPNQLYNSINYNYYAHTLMRKIADDCIDAQMPNGMMPSTVPHYMTDWDDDANWGGAAILVPYRTWKLYGDRALIEKQYPTMVKLIDYYTSRTKDGILQATVSLSDWGQGSAGLAQQTTANFTVTTTYYYMLNVMSEMATELGHTADAERFAAQAQVVRTAFNNKYYKASTGVYEYGNQANYGMPLYYGLVDPANEEAVAAKLAETVRKANYKIKTGEIGLKPVLMSLAKYGYNDVVYRMACQTDYPSYGYWVLKGATTTPEYWNMDFSQNHCMMNHIEEWFFSQLGGISNAGYAYDSICIRPYIPADLTSMTASVGTSAGDVVCEYTRGDDGLLSYHIVVPANTTARIELPLEAGYELYEGETAVTDATDGVHSMERTATSVVLVAGSGDYRLDVKATDNAVCTATAHAEVSYYSLGGAKLATIIEPGIYVVSSHEGINKRYVK